MEMKINFWKDKEKRLLDPTLFSEQAEKWAKAVSNEGGKTQNKSTQLRKFYDEVVRFDSRLKSDNDIYEFEKQLPYIKMLNAKVCYAEARKNVTERFRELIKQSVMQVKDPHDFDAFKSFFEAFMGYYRFHKGD